MSGMDDRSGGPEGEMDAEDTALLAAVGEALRDTDPVPPELVAAGKAAYTWRTIDDELAALAELTFDSNVDDELAGVRGGSGPRLLAFEHDEVVIDVEVTAKGAQLRVVGQVSGATISEVVLESGSERTAVTCDELGQFSTDAVPAGPFRVVVTVEGQPPRIVRSDWITL
jgi:hypothetical protein